MKQAVQFNPNDPHVYVGLGNANGALSRLSKALKLISKRFASIRITLPLTTTWELFTEQ